MVFVLVIARSKSSGLFRKKPKKWQYFLRKALNQ
jgi:hypothetical protein